MKAIVGYINAAAIVASKAYAVYQIAAGTVGITSCNGQSVHHDAVGCDGNAGYSHNVVAVVGSNIGCTDVAGEYGRVSGYIACTAACGVAPVYFKTAAGNGKGAVPVSAALYACGVIRAFGYEYAVYTGYRVGIS